MQKSAERRLQAHLLASTHSRAFDKMAPFLGSFLKERIALVKLFQKTINNV